MNSWMYAKKKLLGITQGLSNAFKKDIEGNKRGNWEHVFSIVETMERILNSSTKRKANSRLEEWTSSEVLILTWNKWI